MPRTPIHKSADEDGDDDVTEAVDATLLPPG